MSQINVDIVNPQSGSTLTLNGDLITQITNAPILATDNTGEIYSPYQIATVSMTSSDVLGMGTNPIELLPASGANNYYDVEKIIFEYTAGSTGYTFSTNDFPTVYFENYNKFYMLSNGGWGTNNGIWICKFGATELAYDGSQYYPKVTSQDLNQSLLFGTWDGINPTLGNGSVRAIIYYRTVTFGTL
jgi:hypothetical protein